MKQIFKKALLLSLPLAIMNLNATSAAKCEPDRVYDAMIVYGMDQDFPVAEQLVPLNPVENTEDFRTQALEYYQETWGIGSSIDPNNQTLKEGLPLQVVEHDANGNPKEFTLWFINLAPEIRYMVHAIDYQTVPQLRSRMPITNVRMHDVAAVLIIGNEFANEGEWKEFYPTLYPESVLAFGYYEMMAMDKHGEEFLLDRIHFHSQSPIATTQYGWQAIPCVVKSDIFGVGLTYGGGGPAGEPLVPEGYLNTRIVMCFPASLKNKQNHGGPVLCKNVKPDLFH